MSLGWFVLTHPCSTLLAMVSIGRLSQREKYLEILLLHQPFAFLGRFLGLASLGLGFAGCFFFFAADHLL